MKKSAEQFRKWTHKAVTLLGMSGIGKTTLSCILPKDSWFHYSGDYRIGTRYLDEHILDTVKFRAMQDNVLRDLLCSDSIYIKNNIAINHLQPISKFLGKIGNPDLGGLSVEEFKYRQKLFRLAEIEAMKDVGDFMEKARNIYGYPHFLNDAGGSICGLTKKECWDDLSDRTLVLYLRATKEMEQKLIQRSQKNPKPLYYEEDFLDRYLAEYLDNNGLRSTDDIIPNEFVIWVFPKLVDHRRPQYELLAEQYGHSIEASKMFQLRDEADFIDCICKAIGA